MGDPVGKEARDSQPEDHAHRGRDENEGADIDGKSEDLLDVRRDESTEDDERGRNEREFDGGVHHGGSARIAFQPTFHQRPPASSG